MSDPCQGGYLLATLMHNWHRPLYTQRGGKGIIKEPYLLPTKTCLMVFTMFPPLPQDWASQQATQTRSLLGHLHYLARKAATSRWGMGWTDQSTVSNGTPIKTIVIIVFIYIYILFYQIGSSTLGPFKITCIRMQEPKGASLEDALPSSHWERGVGKNVLHNSNQEKTYRCFDQVAMLPEAIGNETEDYGIFFASKSWSALDCPIERRCGNHL